MGKATLDRRALLKHGAFAAIAGGMGPAATPASGQNAAAPPAARPELGGLATKGTRLILLGTCGGPVLGQRRHMTSQVLVRDGAAYVVDCGMTVSNRLAEAGVPLKSIEGVFITHHHPDHNAEYGPLLLMAWIGGRYREIRTFGPPPLENITQHYLQSIKPTADLWIADVQVPPFPPINVREVSGPGPVMQDDRVKVTATTVMHPPLVPALAYRFDFKDRSFVFSGDTAKADALAELAKDADVLVHEAMYVQAAQAMVDMMAAEMGGGAALRASAMEHMLRGHTPVAEVGMIAQRAGVKTLVLSHLTPGLEAFGIATSDWIAEARRHFNGEVILAEDFMVI